jgi:2'-5' RNA ligase
VVALSRIFIAVSLPDEERHRLAALLTDVELPGRVVAPPKWHITLRFVGDVDEVTVDRIKGALDEAVLGSPFDVRWAGLGAFPRASKASVLWIGLTAGVDDLGATASTVDEALELAGIDPEDRPYSPHLTISRIRPEEDVTAVIEQVPSLGGGMRVTSIDLYESRSGTGGAKYRVIETFPLD